MRASDRMRKLHSDPAFRAARDERARSFFKANQAELQRKSRAKRRGVDVPPEVEEIWKALKLKRLTNWEAAKFLGLAYRDTKGRRRQAPERAEAGK